MSGTARGSVEAGPAAGLRLLLASPIITVGGRDWTGRDLVTAGALSARWPALEADLARGLACQQSRRPAPELVRAALREFRYSRQLLSGDDLAAWLRARGLTARELKQAAERSLARGHDGDARACGVTGPDRDTPADLGGQAVAELRDRAFAALPAEAVYTGALLDCGQWLADRILCLADAPAPPAAAGEEALLRRERELMVSGAIDESEQDRRARAALFLAASAAYEARAADVCSEQAISALLQRHALDWLGFDLVSFACPTVGAAAEIAALLREGTPPELITEVSGVPARQSRLYLEEAPAAVQGWLAGAVPGTVIGPVAEQDTYLTRLVRARQAPDPSDPALAGKARAQLVGDHMRIRRAGKVRWHERH